MEESPNAEQSAQEIPVPVSQTPPQPIQSAPDPVNSVVKSAGKQRQRTRRACYPCSKRKIKCDRDERTPCTNCSKRPNSELCTFDDDRPRSARPRHSINIGSPIQRDALLERTPPETLVRGLPSSGTGYIHQDDRKLSIPYDSTTPRAILLESKPPGSNKAMIAPPRYSLAQDTLPTPPATSASYNVGPASSFPQVHQLAPAAPILGPAPLLSPLQHRTEELKRLLPSVKHVSKYCELYQNVCHEYYPVDIGFAHVQDVSFQYIHGRLVDSLFSHLESRAIDSFKNEVIQVALISASVAAGVQLSDLEDTARKALVRQYVCHAVQLLRMADAFAYPAIPAYPVLLIISRILQDEMEPFLSWTMLGSIQRLVEMYPTVGWPEDRNDSRYLRTEDNLRRIRHRQEAFLGLMMGQSHRVGIAPFPDFKSWNGVGYLQILDGLAAVASHCGPEDIDREDALYRHADAMKSFYSFDRYSLPHLADKQKCRTVSEMTEHFTLRIHEKLLYLHYCQIIMAACRRLPGHEDEYFKTSDICLTAARECVDAYLEMLPFSTLPLRSWILTTSALRSALVLGVLLAESNSNPVDAERDRHLLQRMLDAFVTVLDDSQSDRARWIRRYPEVFRRLQEMCELLGKHSDGRPATTNGILDGPEGGTALKWMSREAKDDIMIPSRTFRAYFSTHAIDDPPGLASALLSQQTMFGW